MKIFTSFFTTAKFIVSNCNMFIVALLLFVVSTASVSAQTITFTGNTTDFTGAGISALAASTGSVTYYASTDGTFMYLGAFRTGGSTWGTNDHFTFYVDADPRSTVNSGNGSLVGLAWDNQTPTLPTRADYRVAVRTDGNTGSGQGSSFYSTNSTTSGAANWATGGANARGYTQYVSNASNGGIQIRVPLSDFGNPASVYLSMYASFSGGGGGFFGPATGTFTGNTLSGYLRNLGVYRTTGNLTAGAITTAITDFSVAGGSPITAGDYGDITITNTAGTSTLAANTSYSGTLAIGSGTTNATRVGLSTFGLFAGGRGFGGTAGQLSVNGSSGAPFTAGIGGSFNFLGAGQVSGANNQASLTIFPSSSTVTIGGAVDFGNVGGATVTSGLAGTLQINAGGSINTNPPSYISGSTLVYNTGGTYGAGLEWTTNSATAKGVPSAVTLQNNTAVNFGSSNQYRQANGLVTVGSGSSLTMSSVSGGDLRIAAGLTNNNAGTGVGVNTNGRAIQTMGAGTYTKLGTDNLDFLIIGAANQLTLASGTNLSLTNTNASGCLQFTAAGTIFMGGTNTVSIVAGGTVGGTTAGSIGGTAPATSILSLLGTTSWSTGGIITVSTNVGIQVNAGLTITTAGRLSAGNLQINQGGFIGGTNPVVYPASGTLVYNHSAVTGTYGVQALEWPATTGPTNVTLLNNGGTGISFGNNNITARTLAGTLTLNTGQNLSLTGSGTPNLTVLNTVASANSVISGTGNFTHSASGSFTTANTAGVNGTLTTSGTITLPATTSFAFNNATASQVTGALMPATINNLTINNPTASTGTTISSNTLLINGTTTLTAGALVLPTAGGNLVTFTGIISAVTGTFTGSNTSNITTNLINTNFGFTSGGQSLNNWTCINVAGSSATVGLNTPLTIIGTFSFPSATPDLFSTSTGSIIFPSGSTLTQNGTSGARVTGAGAVTFQSGSNILVGSTTGLTSSGLAGLVQTTGTRTFSGGANYTFNNSTTAQVIGDALDGAGGIGKTGPITGNILITNNTGTGATLGANVIINTPGSFNVGVAATSSAILSASTFSITGTGTFSLLGNGATNGSTLITANATGVNGTVAVSGTINLNNGGNNNTNFGFNGSVAQTTGSLLPATVNNLNFSNTFSGSVASPSITLSSSVTTTGTITFAGGAAPLGLVGIGAANTLTINGAVVFTNGSKLVGTTTSNLIIGGSGAIPTTSLFATSGGLLNNFTMNRSGITVTIGQPLTVSGAYSSTAGVIAISNNTLALNGDIAFGAATLTATGPLSIGGSGTITGSLLATSNPLALTTLTMNRSAATLTLGSNVTVSTVAGVNLTAGNISLGTFNLTNTNTAGALGTGSSTSMIVATSTGQAFLSSATGAATKTFPIGDGTNYSPVTLTFTANAVAGTIGARVTATAHPQYDNSGAQTDYLTRFWSFTTTGLTTYTYTSAFTYVAGDINGTEANIKLNRWNGSIWTEDATSTAASNVLTSTTGITNVTFPLNANAYTGRKEITAITYVWNGSTSNDWATAANWTPSGIPSALDNVTIDVAGSFIDCSINSGSKTINNFILNGTGAFAMATGTTLIINGNVTYGGTATASLDCASTVNIASASAQTIPALNFGNLNLTGGNRTLSSTGTIGICGTYTPGAGTITTTSSTVNFNGSGAQTIPATNYNNLTSSSSGARTLANSGTVTVAGTFTPGSNTYTVTGSIVALTSTTGFSFANLPVVASGNSFNTLTINGTGGVFALPYSATTQNVATTLNVTAGTFVINPSSSSLVNTINVGTININGGTLDDRSTGTGVTTNVQVTTAWNQTSGVVTNTGTGVDRILFTGGAATTYTGLTAAASFQYYVVQVANNTTTTLASNLTVNNVSGNNLTVDAGSTMVGSTFLVSTNAAGNSFIINGTYRTAVLAGFSGTATSALSSTNAPTITLGSASTVEYNSTGTATITGRADYANVTVSAAGTFTFNGTTTLSGNYNQSAGTVGLTTTATANNLNVTGNFGMTGGTFNLVAISSATASTKVTVTGNTTTSGSSSINLESVSNANASGIGIFQTTDFTTTSTSTSIIDIGATAFTGNEFRISGNLNKSGTGTFNIASSSNLIGGFVFNKAGTQTFSYAGGASTFANYIVNSGSTLQMLTGLALGASSVPYAFFTVNNGGVIDMGTSVISGGSATVIAANTGFTLASGATMISANATGVSGSVTALTTNYNAAANYVFNSTIAAQNATFPTAVTTINNLTINNIFGAVSINKSFTVNGTLAFTAGNLNLNGSNNITLGASGTIASETNTARVINTGSPTATNGFIGTTRTLGANPGNIGNIGLNISVASAMGSTVIRRFPKVVTNIPTALNSISRVYSIQPTTASSASTIVLNYFDGELNANTETAPSLVTFNSTGANETVAANYVYVGATATDATANTVTFNVANLTTTNTFWTALNSVKYNTFQDGDWNTGSTWVGGIVPPANSDVVVNHIVTVGADSAVVNSLTIAATKSVTVNTLFDLNVTDAIINNGTLTIENNANLLQTNNVTNTGTGVTVVNRNSSALKRLDYTLWSSPVTGQGLYAFSKFTLPNRFYVYDTSTDLYSNSLVGFSFNAANFQYPSPLVSPIGVDGIDDNNVQFTNGKGYLIRVPYNHPTTPAVYNGSFTGVANNGTISPTVSTAANGFNAVGNPYPSRLNVTDFIDGNANTTGPLYFWRKTNTAGVSTSYATLTKTAYVANGSAGGDTGTGFFNTGNEANWAINIGQGFIVKAASGSTISFTNSMRRSSNADQFFRPSQTLNTATNGLYWLNLTDTAGVYSQMAVGYSSEGTLGFDRGIDGENINNEFYLTSLIGADAYAIQGRPDFDASDIVPLSYKTVAAGNYTIAIDHTAGGFSSGSQTIYLKDNLTTTIHDLNASAYTFATTAGTFADRFEIVYQTQLITPSFSANNVVVYNQNNEFVITTGNFVMSSVKVFDIRGRLIEEKSAINASQTTIKGGSTNQVLLVQITSEDGVVVTKKVIR